jgi:hypothetical protein
MLQGIPAMFLGLSHERQLLFCADNEKHVPKIHFALHRPDKKEWYHNANYFACLYSTTHGSFSP